jgi:hypothetical protein
MNAEDSIILVGSWNPLSYAKDVFVKEDYAYISDGQGLTILDISDRTNPQFISSYDTSNLIRDLIVVENKAYFTDRGKGLTILDLSNPFSPKLISSYNNLNLSYSTPSNELAITGDYLYIADGDMNYPAS